MSVKIQETNDINLSVIIPVFNAEQYIEECVSSVLRSRIEKMELILVDDGSSDNSLSLCQLLADQNEQIKAYYKKNGGSASARNYGMSKASGYYLSFIDSDDSVDPIEYRKAFEEVLEAKADIGCFNILIDGNKRTYTPRENSIWESFIREPVYMHSMCNKFFKHTLVDTLTLDEDLVVCEDMLFCAKAFIKAKKIEYIERIAYKYRSVDNSVTHSTNNDKKIKDDIEAVNRLAAVYDRADADMNFQHFMDFRYQTAALRYLTELDVFSIGEYRKHVRNIKAYQYLNNRKHVFLCWCTNKKIDMIPKCYNYLKRRFRQR